MGAYRGQILKNGRETLSLGQILTFKGLFINPSWASSPFVRTKKLGQFFSCTSFFIANTRRDLRVERIAGAIRLR